MSPAKKPTLIDAALAFDLEGLGQLIHTVPAAELQRRHAGGVTVLHGLVAAFHFFKAGELSTLVPWPNPSRTVYSHDVRGVLARAANVRESATYARSNVPMLAATYIMHTAVVHPSQ